MSHKNKQKSNLNLAMGFIGLVFFIVIISFVFKVFWVVKESKFDGSNKFNIAVYDSRGAGLISFSPKEKSISILKLEDKNYNNPASELQIPIDGYQTFTNKEFNYSNISSNLFTGMFLAQSRKGMTFLDVLRLAMYSRTVSSNSTYERKLLKQYSQTERSAILSLTFRDPSILTEGKSVEVVNATEVSGLGSRLASLVTNMGGNVVLVSSSENKKNSEIVFFEDEGYTVKKFSDYLGFPKRKSKNRGVADVIIIIGQDSLSKLRF
ncbi:MAG: hypothetical protein A2171_00040 [Candidatus Levybacteria bacterium RBG_13_35_9]|nr:MAG: hypothetical protein A2171_00040 [Candidatus Levybacteria bacterium RBG_13_35_9]